MDARGTTRRRALTGALALGVVGWLCVGPVGPAQAVTRSASGARCTIVGTPGNDVLRGTAHRDVICGLGGNDVLIGNGGDDVLDGGAGSDRLDGGSGDDRLYGGAGNDTLVGGAGSDLLDGGRGTDTVSYAGRRAGVSVDLDNRWDDGAPRERDDVTSTVENVVGGLGADRLTGSAVANVLTGGAGNDTLTGGAGNDRLAGGVGDDVLVGGAGVDVLDGGKGRNQCRWDSDDPTPLHCISDAEPPTVTGIDVLDPSVDVTDADAQVHVRATVVDDKSGVAWFGIFLSDGDSQHTQFGQLALQSGTANDGVYTGTVTIPRGAPAGMWRVEQVTVNDATNNTAMLSADSGHLGLPWPPLPPGTTTFQVVDSFGDSNPPVVGAGSVTPSAVDVTGQRATVHVVADVSDSGSGLTSVVMRARSPIDPNWSGSFVVAGNGQGSTWEADVVLPADVAAGTWTMEVIATDREGNRTDAVVGTLSVTSEHPDVTAPAPVSVVIDTPVVRKAESTRVGIDITVSDPHAGTDPMSRAWAYLCTPTGLQYPVGGEITVTAHDDATELTTYHETFTLPLTASVGRWTVCMLGTLDTSANDAVFVPTAQASPPTRLALSLLDSSPGFDVR
jgi:hypothetical protein